MLGRQRTGSVLCPSCGRLVGVNDDKCLNCGRLRPGMWGMAGVLRGLGQDMGFVQLVMGGTILLYGLTLLLGGVQPGGGGFFSFLSPTSRTLVSFGASGAYPVFVEHRWWTVLSAGWLHGSLLHIFFNLMWVRQLAPETAELYGPSRMVVIYTAASATGFLLSSAAGAFLPGVPIIGGATLTVGASAPLFGLLAALVYYGRRAGSRSIGSQAWTWALILFFMGFFLGRVDNWAHLGGFLGGYAVARWLDPLRQERTDHTLLALACLAATLAAIVASLVVPLRLGFL